MEDTSIRTKKKHKCRENLIDKKKHFSLKLGKKKKE